MIQCPVDKIVVEIDELFPDKKGSIYIDTTYNPQDHIRIFGKVVSAPRKVSKEYQSLGIKPVVQAGDRVYFNYLTCMSPENRLDVIEDGVPKIYWLVDYHEAMAYVRDGQINTIGIWVLMEPVFHEEQKTAGGLIIPEAYRKKEDLYGIYRFGNDPELVGEKVYFDPIGKFLNKIEDVEYYCMYDYNLHGVMVPA